MMDIRMATPGEDEILVGHYLKIWDSYGTPPEHFRGRSVGFPSNYAIGERIKKDT